MLSRYNVRINEQLIRCCQQLTDDELTKDRQSFFPNVISYWNHILFGDLILLKRMAINGIAGLTVEDFIHFPEAKSPQDIYHRQLTAIGLLRQQVDRLITQFFEGLTEQDCLKMITYQSTEGEVITKNVADICQHLFNHQTHHRGQLTCILSQLGLDYGCMDLPVIVPEGSHV